MNKEFEMSDLEYLSYFLGIKFLKIKTGMILHQRKYVREVIKRSNMLQTYE